MQRKSKVKRYNWDFHLKAFKFVFFFSSQLQPGSEKNVSYSLTDIVALSTTNYFTNTIFLNQGVENQNKAMPYLCYHLSVGWGGTDG